MRLFFVIFLSISLTKTNAQKLSILLTTPSPDAFVSVAQLKYNKDFAYSFTLDDSYDDAFSCGYHIFNGGRVPLNDVLYAPLYFTDGCGNKIPFRGGIAWNSANALGIDIHTGNVINKMTWKQLDTMYSSGWDVFNHSFSHKSAATQVMTTTDYKNEVTLNPPALREKTQNKIETPIFVVPYGDSSYENYAFNYNNKAVFNQSGNVIGYGGLNVEKDVDFSKVIHRQLLEESLTSLHFFDSIAVKSQKGTHYWYNEFTHRIDDVNSIGFNFYTVYNYFNKMANTYGAVGNGKDNLWVAPLQEVTEYLMMRKNLGIQFKSNASLVEVNFDFAKVPFWFRRNSITLLLTNTANIASIDFPKNWNVTYQTKGTNKIINIDFGSAPFYIATSNIANLSTLKIIPNIADDEIQIETLYDLTDAQYKITDVFGRTYATQPVASGNRLKLDVSNLTAGFYIFSLTSKNKIYSERFVIAR